MTAEPAEGRPIAAWMQMLEFIDAALARRLAEVEERPGPADGAGSSAQGSLQALDERVRRMQARLDQAGATRPRPTSRCAPSRRRTGAGPNR